MLASQQQLLCNMLMQTIICLQSIVTTQPSALIGPDCYNIEATLNFDAHVWLKLELSDNQLKYHSFPLLLPQIGQGVLKTWQQGLSISV